MLKNYAITLHNKEDMESLINDLEQSKIVERSLLPKIKKINGRGLLYQITLDESNIIKNDSRVKSVELLDIIREGIQPTYTQTANWNKAQTSSSSHRNWGLYRCVLEDNISGWGSNSNSNQIATFDTSGTGRNVDVIIIDGHFNPAHPEMLENEDGTGNSRVNQINWWDYTSQAVELDDDFYPGYSGTYVYTPYIDGLSASRTSNNNHGMHVAGTVAGNRQGWAKKSNIYNINPYATNANVDQFFAFIMWDYIRAFHLNKPINPITGRRNPTICNGSYGTVWNFPFNYGSISTGSITSVNYRGVNYTPSGATFTPAELENFGIYWVTGGTFANTAQTSSYSDAIAADIEQAIEDGIIVVASAGNNYGMIIDVPGGPDYDNYFVATLNGTNYDWYYNRGSAPGSAPGVICVGAIGSLSDESKANFSSTGPRVDIFAPGQNILSSVLQQTSQDTGFTDARNPSYRNAKNSGTSMSSPQVAGVLACLLETYPRMTAEQALNFVVSRCKTGRITDTAGGITDQTALKGAENRYLFYQPERSSTGAIYPNEKYGLRTSQGQVFPRSRIYRYGS